MMACKLTHTQRRLLDAIRRAEPYAEYWPVVNDWVHPKSHALALRNINATVAALVRDGYVVIDDDGMFRLTERGRLI